MILEYRVQSI